MKIKTSVVGFCVVVIILTALVFWIRQKPVTMTPSQTGQTETNGLLSASARRSQGDSTTTLNNPVSTNTRPNMAALARPSSLPLDDKVAVFKQVLEANDVDIVFYGKLEDQSGNALGNAPINFEIRYENVNGKGVSRGQVVSDGNGLFTVSGYKGERLSCIPEKPGYVLVGHNNGGIYSHSWPEAQRVHSAPNNPVIIKMWKLQGGEHLVHFQTETRVPLDGTPTTFDLQTGQRVQSGGDLTISVKTTPTPNIRQRYDWQMKIQPVNGGLISSSEDFEQMFQAPESGYETEFNMEYQKDVMPWTTTFNGGYYFTSRNQGCYGKLGIEVLSDVVRDGTVPVIFNGYLNPASSRNLEIDPTKVTEAKP
jgi:hypothetical protein